MKGSATKTILLVEDDPTYRRPLRFILEQRGYRVVAVDSVAAAAAVAREGNIDLALLDYWLPDGTAADIVANVHNGNGSGDPVPVVVMTSLPSARVKDRVLSEGAARLIAKPRRAEPILELVEELL